MENSVQKPPMSAEQLIDLRARVLRGETVSDDELRHALSSLAMARGTGATAASQSSGKKVAAVDYKPAGSVAERFAAFKAKTQQTDTSGDVQIDKPKPQ